MQQAFLLIPTDYFIIHNLILPSGEEGAPHPKAGQHRHARRHSSRARLATPPHAAQICNCGAVPGLFSLFVVQ